MTMAGIFPDKIIIQTATSQEPLTEDIKDPKKAKEVSAKLIEDITKAGQEIAKVTHGHLSVEFDKEASKNAIFADLTGAVEGQFQLKLKRHPLASDFIGSSLEITPKNLSELADVLKEAAQIGKKLSDNFLTHIPTAVTTDKPNAEKYIENPTEEKLTWETIKKDIKQEFTETHQDIKEGWKETKQEWKEELAGSDAIKAELGVNHTKELSNDQYARVELAVLGAIKSGIKEINARERDERYEAAHKNARQKGKGR